MTIESILAAEALAADPRVAQAKQLLLEAVSTHQKKLTGIRPPIPELKLHYDDLLETMAQCRGSKLWFPYIGSGIGNGALVELLDGSVKYDFITGIGTQYFGHSHPDLIASSIDASISDCIMQGHLQQNEDSLELMKLLTQTSNLDHCFLTSSGAMANENALKIIFQKRFPANRILAFDHNFSGRTVTLAQVTDKPSFREGLPKSISVDYVPFFDAANPGLSTQLAIDTLKKHLARYPKEHALMIFELIQGEAGFYPGSREFFIALMKILKEHHITILDDEVQAFGRTSQLFAFQHFDLADYVEVVVIGKMSQVCATLFNADHRPKPGLLSQTFISSTAAIRASKVILEKLLHGDYFGPTGKIMQIYQHFSNRLAELSKKHPKCIQGPFGVGAMIAFTPFDGNLHRTTRFVHALFDAGVLSFIAGTDPTRVRFLLPAAIVTFDDIDKVTQIIEETLLKSNYGAV